MPKLVAIGDSLTQGFQSGCISRTHVSYPALIATAMEGTPQPPRNFKYPCFNDPNGLPLNLEVLARKLRPGEWNILGENLIEGFLKMIAGILKVFKCVLICLWNLVTGCGDILVGFLKILYLWGLFENNKETLKAYLKRLRRRKGSIPFIKSWNWLANVWNIGFLSLASYINEIEVFWERGDGIEPSGTGPLHHNLAVWGFSVVDADTLTFGTCHREILKHELKKGFLSSPDYPIYRTARRTLNPSYDAQYDNLTQIGLAKKIGDDEPIENLIFWLGANNALGTILRLGETDPIVWANEGDLYQLAHARKETLWPPILFEKVYRRVIDQLAEVNAEKIYIGNVPHLNVSPVIRGVSLIDPQCPQKNEQDAEGYFEYYTNCWVDDRHFRQAPSSYACFTRDTLKMINGVIDEYNRIIAAVVEEQNGKSKKAKWKLVNTCAMLDKLDYRRNKGEPSYLLPQGLKDALRKNSRTEDRFYANGEPILDTRFLCVRPNQTDPNKKYEGGIVSLDGVHPTTIGYGLVAYEFMQAMDLGHLATDRWWEYVVDNDTLVTDTPKVLEDVLGFLQVISKKGILQDVGKALS